MTESRDREKGLKVRTDQIGISYCFSLVQIVSLIIFLYYLSRNGKKRCYRLR